MRYLPFLICLAVYAADYPTETGRFSHEQLIGYAQEYGTPLYVYDGDRIKEKFHKFSKAFKDAYGNTKIYYALKANTNLSIVALLKKEGASAECISMGEIYLARKLGWKGEDILFTSSSKSPVEMEYAVNHDVVINLDSMGDLENLIATVEKLKKKARVSFRLNTDVDPKTHKHISTSHKTTKFGILFENDQIMEGYKRAYDHPLLEVWGIHSHIGSQIMDDSPFVRNVKLVTTAVKRLKQELGIELKFMDLGGGLGIPYRDGQEPLEPEVVANKMAKLVKQELKDLGYMPALWMEPGRYFVGDAGFLVARVNSVKDTPYKHFINVDTGFNHLVRPILYEAYHRVRVLGRKGEREKFDVAGNICETGDILAYDRMLPRPSVGDYVAFMDAGAYGFTMASEYNMFTLPAEIMVRGDKVDVIRKRPDIEDLFRNQILLKDLE
ncbi:MAG: diaminopimelate decarboxylase [Acidobacteriota bacterium]|nr:diaminopimelate decarboxylase [Acidobacteriota bacterium]